ncbi:hypothetical protein CPB83DRAFT_882138 [Crepidotus variabilis]|uniref:Hydrophobin n=1 Tax=Crepidotus variabilis TaxID=179855 RepID=A0A9P6JSK6_9AGAR|nr:hypothetical protein CPB83DRAFT_882138 [Crepidotus variabilis]
MKFTGVISVLIVAAISTCYSMALSIEVRETNGQRMARGLPPLPPVDIAQRSELAIVTKRGQPSNYPPPNYPPPNYPPPNYPPPSYPPPSPPSPPQCHEGTTYCCDYIKDHHDGLISELLGHLGLHFLEGVKYGKSCTKCPIEQTCHKSRACCTGSNYGSIVSHCAPMGY